MSKPKDIRHWYIQKPTEHNCPIGQHGPLANQGAVFTEFEPTIHLYGCQWIKVYSADDLQAYIGMGITRYVDVMTAYQRLLDANKKLREGLQDMIDSGYDQAGHCVQYLSEADKIEGGS